MVALLVRRCHSPDAPAARKSGRIQSDTPRQSIEALVGARQRGRPPARIAPRWPLRGSARAARCARSRRRPPPLRERAEERDRGAVPTLPVCTEPPARAGGTGFTTLRECRDVLLHGVFDDPRTGKRAFLDAKTTIDRREWGLVWNMPVPQGLLVGNEVTIEFSIEPTPVPPGRPA